MNHVTLKNGTQKFQPSYYAGYATYVTFQQNNQPSVNTSEGEVYFPGTYELYGFKVAVYVLPLRLLAGCTTHYLASIANLERFCQNKLFHVVHQKK